jgi:hypothetical protein
LAFFFFFFLGAFFVRAFFADFFGVRPAMI